MRIIARRTLLEFVAKRVGHKDQPALKAALDAWFAEVSKADWISTADVKRLYATASIVRQRWQITASARRQSCRLKQRLRACSTPRSEAIIVEQALSADRIVFNIKGNDYRLVVAVDFEKAIAWIKWIGTHKDYDRIDVKEVRHGS